MGSGNQNAEIGNFRARNDNSFWPNDKRRPKDRGDGIPSRNDISLFTEAEDRIRAAMMSVEMAGASEALTAAVNLLGAARDKVADHIEALP